MEKDFQHIQFTLQQLIDHHPKLQHSVKQVEAKQVVREVLGDLIMPYISSIKTEGTLIIIRSNESVLRQEIQQHKSTLLKNINDRLAHREPFTDIVLRG